MRARYYLYVRGNGTPWGNLHTRPDDTALSDTDPGKSQWSRYPLSTSEDLYALPQRHVHQHTGALEGCISVEGTQLHEAARALYATRRAALLRDGRVQALPRLPEKFKPKLPEGQEKWLQRDDELARRDRLGISVWGQEDWQAVRNPKAAGVQRPGRREGERRAPQEERDGEL